MCGNKVIAPCGTNISVSPSGLAALTPSTMILPPAPVRLSTTTGRFSCTRSWSASRRAVWSAEPPAAKPTMIFTGWADWPLASGLNAASEAAPSASTRRRLGGAGD